MQIVLNLFFLCLNRLACQGIPMNIQFDLSGSKAIFTSASVEQMLGAAVLALAVAICLLAWKLKK